jgi:hypothetical protein
MKRSEMIENVASELVHEWTGFMPFDKAKQLAEICLNRIEKEGMRKPLKYIKVNDELLGNIEVAIDKWEPEEESDFYTEKNWKERHGKDD